MAIENQSEPNGTGRHVFWAEQQFHVHEKSLLIEQHTISGCQQKLIGLCCYR